MSTDTLIVLSNAFVAFATIALTLVTLIDVHHEDQKTLRELLIHPITKPIARIIPPRGRKRHEHGKHED